MTNEELQQIKDELTKISPWPWCVDCGLSGIRHLIRNCYDDFGCDKPDYTECKRFGKYDGDFLALAPSRIDALVREVERLKEALTRIRDCDFISAPYEPMDAIYNIAREALEDK